MNEIQQRPENPNPHMADIHIPLKGYRGPYHSSIRLHEEFLAHARQEGKKANEIPHKRRDSWNRIIDSIPNRQQLIEQFDLIYCDWNTLKCDKSEGTQKLCDILKPLFARNGHAAFSLLNRTAQLELTHHIRESVFHQEIAYQHSRNGFQGESLVDGFLKRHGFRKYESLYDIEIVREVCRVWGVKAPKEDKSRQHWPGVGRFFNDFIYAIFPSEVQAEVENRRGKYKHPVFREDRRKDTLLKRVADLMPILRLCESGEKDLFIALLEKHDRRVGLEVQVTARMRIRLSTLVTNQLLLPFEDEAAD